MIVFLTICVISLGVSTSLTFLMTIGAYKEIEVLKKELRKQSEAIRFPKPTEYGGKEWKAVN